MGEQGTKNRFKGNVSFFCFLKRIMNFTFFSKMFIIKFMFIVRLERKYRKFPYAPLLTGIAPPILSQQPVTQ